MVKFLACLYSSINSLNQKIKLIYLFQMCSLSHWPKIQCFCLNCSPMSWSLAPSSWLNIGQSIRCFVDGFKTGSTWQWSSYLWFGSWSLFEKLFGIFHDLLSIAWWRFVVGFASFGSLNTFILWEGDIKGIDGFKDVGWESFHLNIS